MRFSLLAAATAVAAAPTELATRQDNSCRDVHIFLAKGWNEPYPGRQGGLAGAICYGLPSCDYEDIIYENAEGSDFCIAVSEGARNGLNQMNSYAARCPNSKLVISGYSQGGFIVSNILGGGGGPFSGGCTVDYNAPLDGAAAAQLGAAMVFGDVQHTKWQTYNWLEGWQYDSNDPMPVERQNNINRFASKMRSWCDPADPVCAAQGPGPFNVDKHLDYFDIYRDEAGGLIKYWLGY